MDLTAISAPSEQVFFPLPGSFHLSSVDTSSHKLGYSQSNRMGEQVEGRHPSVGVRAASRAIGKPRCYEYRNERPGSEAG